MAIKKGDKVLMKEKKDLPEELQELSNFAGKVCTVSAILKRKPLIFEVEEDVKINEKSLSGVLKSVLFDFETMPTKKNFYSEEFVEKIINEDHSFSWALIQLKKGIKVARKNWNGKGLWLELQKPDGNSKMTLPYIYLNYPKGDKVPWFASQTDMLEEDWFEVK